MTQLFLGLLLLVWFLLSSEHKRESTIHDQAGGKRVRIPGTRLAAATVLAVVGLAACGGGDADGELEAAQQQSTEALEDIERLQGRLDELEAELEGLGADNDELAARLGDVNGRVKKSVGKLDTALTELEGSTTTAQSNADDALGVAAEAARDISILTNRLDYHLRNHGGG